MQSKPPTGSTPTHLKAKRKVAARAGQVYRFAHSMVQNSTIVMYDPAERLYHIGTINGRASQSRNPKL